MEEKFGHIIIDGRPKGQAAESGAHQGADSRAQSASGAVADKGPRDSVAEAQQSAAWTEQRQQWQRRQDERQQRQLRLKAELMPDGEQPYRMHRLGDLCQKLGINIEGGRGRRHDREVLGRLRYELARLDLRMGRAIIGKAVPKADEQVGIYPMGYGEVPTRGTLPASMFMAAWLISADGATERDFDIIDRWIEHTVGSKEQAIPAMATMRWLCARRLILTAWRKTRCSSLAKFVHRRAALVQLLLGLVADGDAVSAARVERLATIYRLIGLDPADIHSDLHRLTTAASGSISARRGSHRPAGMDRRLLDDIAADTLKAQEMLGEIFEEKEANELKKSNGSKESKESKESKKSKPSTTSTNSTISTISTKSTKAGWMAEVLKRPIWSHDELNELARRQGLTLGAMLETLNDLAYDTVGDPVAEDDGDNIVIDMDTAQEMLGSVQT